MRDLHYIHYYVTLYSVYGNQFVKVYHFQHLVANLRCQLLVPGLSFSGNGVLMSTNKYWEGQSIGQVVH